VRISNKKILFLTNASCYSCEMLHSNFKKMGLDVLPSEFFTSAMATAEFVKYQNPAAKAFVIGEQVLLDELVRVGIELDDVRPDYVIMGEKHYYSKAEIGLAVNLVRGGAKLIGTNKDAYDAVEGGTIEPSTGAWITVIEKAAGVPAYFIGKPSPVMMRIALSQLSLHAKDCALIGDRMDTDIIGGVEASIDTVLVLSGVTKMKDLQGHTANQWGWVPYLIIDSVGELATTTATTTTTTATTTTILSRSVVHTSNEL